MSRQIMDTFDINSLNSTSIRGESSHEQLLKNTYSFLDLIDVSTLPEEKQNTVVKTKDEISALVNSSEPITRMQSMEYVDSVRNLLNLIDVEELKLESKQSVNALKSLLSSNATPLGKHQSTEVLQNAIDNGKPLERLSSVEILKSLLSFTDNPIERKQSWNIFKNYVNSQQIQKPMTSVNSFRFQQLASCLADVEKEVIFSEEEEEDTEHVVSVNDDLDNLLDDRIPQPVPHRPTIPPMAPMPSAGGFNTTNMMYMNQGMVNPDLGMPMMQGMAPGYIGHQPFNYEMQVGAPPVNGLFSVNPQQGFAMPSPIQEEASKSPKFCSKPNCHNLARTKGYCQSHGGGRRCKIEGCMKSAQTGHLCIAHGGGKKCKAENCNKTAQSRGLCKTHGGGVRCKFPGCEKSCQSGGYCRGHGGGKRCSVAECMKWAQRNGLCAKHSQ